MLPDTFVLIFSILVAIKVCITKRKLGRAIPTNNTSVTVSLVVRVIALTILLSIGNVMGITSLVMDPNLSAVGWNFALTLMTVSVFLLFGTQKDLLYAWCFWNKTSERHTTKLPKDMEMANVRTSLSHVDLLQPRRSEERREVVDRKSSLGDNSLQIYIICLKCIITWNEYLKSTETHKYMSHLETESMC
ncbi:hypothetical protein DFS33DRAFT_153248 [Desarmillaria ectypa]|nr:hypothetical protein DFS33DRAFT_153248 [Desarmillaria ectypa]